MLQEAYPLWPALRPIARPARRDDIPALLGLAQEGIDNCLVPDTPIDRDHLATNWEKVFSRPDAFWHMVAEFEGELVGYTHGSLGGQWHTPRTMAYLCTMYIRKEHRSAALFGEMVESFVAWAKQVGAEATWSCLTNGMTGPILDRLWRRHGFHCVGTMYERTV